MSNHEAKADDIGHRKHGASAAATFTPLCDETRVIVDTATAAHHLNRRPQTLRIWACLENGPLRPVRVSGRLGWRVDEIRRLLGVVTADVACPAPASSASDWSAARTAARS